MISKLQNLDKAAEEAKAEALKDKGTQSAKIDELKAKYDKAMDELTQSKINFEREKALNDQKISF